MKDNRPNLLLLLLLLTAKRVLYIRSLPQDHGFPPTGPTRIYEDSEACIRVINARQATERTRHIDTHHLPIREFSIVHFYSSAYTRHPSFYIATVFSLQRGGCCQSFPCTPSFIHVCIYYVLYIRYTIEVIPSI